MRVNILDNGLQGKTGHHFDLVLQLAAGFRARGWEVQACGAAQSDRAVADALASADCAYVALFSHFAYAPLELGQDAMTALEHYARIMAGELARLPTADLNLFPSLKPLEFFGYALSGLAGTGVGYAHAEPGSQGQLSGQVWQRAAVHLKQQGMRFSMGAIDPVIGDFLAGYLDGLAVETFPIAFSGRSKTKYADQPATIGFFGSQRDERGKALIPAVADQLLAQGYRVVLHDTNGQFVNTNAHPYLHIVSGFVDDLQAAMLACDIVVCPMQREHYLHRMSGVACNAMAAGLPLVLPAGTLAAARFVAQGSCRTYLEHSSAGILQAVRVMAQDYPHYATAAKSAARRWSAEQGVERFIDKLIEKTV